MNVQLEKVSRIDPFDIKTNTHTRVKTQIEMAEHKVMAVKSKQKEGFEAQPRKEGRQYKGAAKQES